MHEALTRETPSKVMALTAAVLASMMFLFFVSASEVSFNSTLAQAPLPKVALFERMELGADLVSAGIGNLVANVLVEPAQTALATYGENLAQAWSRAEYEVALIKQVYNSALPAAPGAVAGAYVEQTPK